MRPRRSAIRTITLTVSIAASLAVTVATAQPAQDDRAETEPAEASRPATASEPTSAAQPSAQDQGTEGVFLPSEEISEDFAVPFPVDI